MKKLGTFYGNHGHQDENVMRVSLKAEPMGKRLQFILLIIWTQIVYFACK